MISFKVITETNKDNIIESLSAQLSLDASGTLAEIIFSLDSDLSDVEFAAALSCDCALIRVFDMGRYLFMFPYELTESADIKSALDAISEYTMREEIPLVLTDVPPEMFQYLSGYRHMDIDAEDTAGSAYRVRIKTECELNNKIPSVDAGRVKLNQLTKADISLYAALCKDQNVNKYWGYNYLEEVAEPTDEYFLENAEREFNVGIAASMAIRVNGKFAGESTIYAFDGKGGAEFALRLLPKWQGRGIGTESVRATVLAARALGLVRLRAEVMADNLASVAMLKKVTSSHFAKGDRIVFEIKLEEEKL